jgi:two-component system LytT family response regulator
MEKIKCAIVDDEDHATDTLQSLLQTYCPQVEIVGIYHKPGDFLNDREVQSRLNLLFLDIEMSPFSGFWLLQELHQSWRQLPFDVIFQTAYDQYALKAIQNNALDYLLKPIMPVELQKAVRKWEDKRVRHFHPLQWRQLEENLKEPQKLPEKIALPNQEGYFILEITNILRCEADRNYTHVKDRSGQTHLVCRSLKEFEQILEPYGFLRVHHSHVIHPDAVVKILREGGGTLVLTDQARVVITKNKEGVMEKLFERIKKV